jgi:osmoprotectant transport system substrate-binding protein
MNKTALLLALSAFLFVPRADACVGRLLHIGVVDSVEGRVLAEVLSLLINERTGSTVAIQFYNDEQELDEALKVNKVDVSIDNTAHAMRVLNKASLALDPAAAYELAKASYEKEKGLVWLKPFGFVHREGASAPDYTSTLLRTEVLNNFPALPRVLGKLGGAMNDEAYRRLMKNVESGEKPKKAARDFLKAKKLI